MANSKRVKAAIQRAFEKLNSMSDEELRQRFQDHEPGEFAQILERTMGLSDIKSLLGRDDAMTDNYRRVLEKYEGLFETMHAVDDPTLPDGAWFCQLEDVVKEWARENSVAIQDTNQMVHYYLRWSNDRWGLCL